MVVEYHKRNYFGENIIIIGAGDHKHEDLVNMVASHFGSLPQKSPLPAPPGLDSMRRPKFCDEFSLIQYEQENPDHLNVSFLQEAPSQVHPDYFPFLLIQRILSDKPESQLDIELSKCPTYFSYSTLILKKRLSINNLNHFNFL